MPQDKVRVYVLARELNMESKDLLDLCQQANIDVKNQLSSLDPEQRDLLVDLVRKGGTAPSSAQPKPPGPLPKPPTPMRILDAPRSPLREGKALDVPPVPPPVPVPPVPPPAPAAGARPPAAPPIPPMPPPARPESPGVSATPLPEPVPLVRDAPAVLEVPPTAEPAPEPAVTAPAAQAPPADVAEAPAAPERPAEAVPAGEAPAVRPPAVAAPAAEATPPARPQPPPAPTPRPPLTGVPSLSRPPGPLRDLGAPRVGPARPTDRRPRPNLVTRQPSQARPGMAAPPAQKLRQEGKEKPPPPPTGPRVLARIPKEMQEGDKPIRIEDLLRPPAKPQAAPGATDEPDEPEDEGTRGKGGSNAAAKKRPGGVVGREQRHAQRSARAKDRGGKVDVVDDDRPQRVGAGIKRGRKPKPPGTLPRKGNRVTVEVPITVRSLSEALGIPAGQLLMQLMNLGAAPSVNINSTLDPELAEALALERGVELAVKRPPDAEEELEERLRQPDNPEDLVPRAPIVTIMGHVDHGKTSLLDRIRSSNVVDTEAGGITQSLRAWRVVHNGKAITFLDTPGHEAFTKMRARGANVTDIAVIVVAADDGVMPQTEEAISHAKAAGVKMVVAINKIDLPNANLRKAEQQLYGLSLLPDNMGGDIPFVQTSAVSGKGIDDLLENILLVAELAELKANPNKPARGTCLEATVSEGEGVFATVLIQDGTLLKGDVVVCGATSGRVRAMYDDLGRPIAEAGPSVPVRVTGLDEVPNADDAFVAVRGDAALGQSREIAAKRKEKLEEAALVPRTPVSLESLSEAKIAELKVILKADVRGSIEAIRKELEKLHHDEVRVRVLHAGVGGITENDVNLALTSPEDTLIVGFNAVPDDRARAVAEERGVKIREYDIIYKLTGDIRAALEGKLKPREEVIHLGRAVVRATFKISRVGTIAGCYVTQGVLERSAFVRVIRGGVVVYPPADRTVGLDSLKRVKDDAREVQQGYECGVKITGYDDVKVDDVIECYRIQKVQRTLEK